MKKPSDQDIKELKEKYLARVRGDSAKSVVGDMLLSGVDRMLDLTEWGFDLTDFKTRSLLKEFCKEFGLALKPVEIGSGCWLWEGATMNMVTANNPFKPKHEGEAYVSYMMLEGFYGTVLRAGQWILERNDDYLSEKEMKMKPSIYIKGEDGIGRNSYISGTFGLRRRE